VLVLFRSRDIQEIYVDIQEFNARSTDLSQWLVDQIDTLENSDNNGLTVHQLKDKVQSQIQSVPLSKIHFYHCSYLRIQMFSDRSMAFENMMADSYTLCP